MEHFSSLSDESMHWYEAMIDAYHHSLSESEKEELETWEKENLGRAILQRLIGRAGRSTLEFHPGNCTPVNNS